MLSINNTAEGYLKNVGIKGNTIQDANNLADIRSVGDKVEGQDLYEIPLLCVNANLFYAKWELGTLDSFGAEDNNTTRFMRCDFNKVCEKTSYSYKAKDYSSFVIVFYDSDKKYLSQLSTGATSFTTPENCKFIRFRLFKVDEGRIDLSAKVTLTQGLDSPQLIDRIEHKLTILSPKQLKSFDGAKDRIIEKDGVWVHEENVVYDEQGNGTKLPTPIDTPLPHDQQIRLRTFANRTNISFLCDVEGTIKADVPKSLGATVNTHTTQIDSLNQELERVKKLEESTVSTVTTESDFTVVEQTSNGYFEDVELKGRTLVNLCPPLIEKYISIKKDIDYPFTVIITCPSNNTSKINIDYTTKDNIRKYITVANGAGTFSLYVSDAKYINEVYFYGSTPSSYNGYYGIILEGDHTQNPPSYFEGLASVGDGTDEIVVSSVNGNLAYDIKNVKTTDGVTLDTQTVSFETYPNLIDGETYTIQTSHYGTIYHGGASCGVVQPNIPFTFTLKPQVRPTDKVAIGIYASNYDNSISENSYLILSRGDKISPNKQHKADKKKLLYFDPTDNTLKKPIIREWDSVEKHSDGKYYYHKRSGEVVLNGDENWIKAGNSGSGFSRYALLIDDSKLTTQHQIISMCDILPTLTHGNLYNANYSCTSFADNKQIFILSKENDTLDKFKAWLKVNPVTVVYQLATEQVYECTNIDLITYQNETNYIVKSGVLSPTTVLKVHSNISNVVSLLQKKVSLLESNVKADQATQNAIILDTDMRVMDIEFVLMESMGLTLNEGGNTMFKKNERGINEFNLMKERIESGEYTSEYLEKCINKYKYANRLSQEEYDILYDMIYPPVYDIPTVLPN